jgi:predicted Ser/Thr protein kinase
MIVKRLSDPHGESEPVHRALRGLSRSGTAFEQRPPIPFSEFLKETLERPQIVIRSIFQLFHDMIKAYMGEGADEYPSDPESIHFVHYDSRNLFVQDVDHPFFADRLFANRLVNLAESFKRGAQQNKIYIFRGPPGCGKSTFLNNLLHKFETYAHTEPGMRYEAVWRFDRRKFGPRTLTDTHPLVDRLSHLLETVERERSSAAELSSVDDAHGLPEGNNHVLEIPCPSHDNPLLLIPKGLRRTFYGELFAEHPFRQQLFTEKEYEWVFQDSPCTICSSLYDALLYQLKTPENVLETLFARMYRFNRRLGEGISVFNPGDKPRGQQVFSRPGIQKQINRLLEGNLQVKYLVSQYARTNNGIYALMDIKSHNTERLIELHNIISEGIHKVEEIEENVNSLLLAVMNPEDQANIEGFQSFLDRVEYINIPYVMDIRTEVEIYRNIFGRQIEESFLPRVLPNFARVIIASRMKRRSDTMLEWISHPERYRLYCDEDLQLLKMEIYTGRIPNWLSDEDRKRLTAKRRRRIIAESESEGDFGISGRDAIKIFNDFFSTYARADKLINMSDLCKFFTKVNRDVRDLIPSGFLDSLLRMYDYTVLQEVKEALYYYNEDQIAREIMNYLFAINFETNTTVTCTYTGEKLEISEDFFSAVEYRLLGRGVTHLQRIEFRRETQREYISRTLQQILIEGRNVTATNIFKDLRERYVHNLKEKVLDPFLENENFRRAIKDADEPEFTSYDRKIREDVAYLIGNLKTKYHYSQQGAKEVSMYVIDNDLAKKFS